MSFGKNLRRIRLDQGLTLGDLSSKAGIGLSQISKLELNKANPRLDTIYNLMQALDCSADRLLLDKEKSGMTAVLKEQLERIALLPTDDQENLIRIMDKFCIANGLKTMLDDHKLLIRAGSHNGGVKDVLPIALS